MLRLARLVPVLVLLAAAHAGSAAASNLLSNPGFETPLAHHPWMPAGWDTSRSGLDWVFFGRDTLAPHGGRYAVNVANVSARIPMAHNWSQTLLVGRESWGKDLVFSVWTRSLGLEGRAYIVLQAYRDTVSKMARIWNVPRDESLRRLDINKVDDPLLDFGWARQYFSENETEWVRREVRVHVAPGVNVVFVRVGLLGTGQLMIDDASLTLEPGREPEAYPTRVNLIADPSFEGDGNSWEYSLPPYDGLRVEKDTTVARSGRASLFVAGTSGMIKARVGTCLVFCNRDLPGKRVKASVWIKTDSLRASGYVKVYAHTLAGPLPFPSPTQVGGTSDWTKVSVDLDVPPDTYALWVWFLTITPAEGRAWFDDASFEVLGPATGMPPGHESGAGG